MFGLGATLLRNETHKRFGKLGEEENFEEILRRRYHDLQYDDYGDSSDTGGGSIASAIATSAASLGGAYLVSQSQPMTTQSPTLLRPPAATGTLSSGSGSTFMFLGVIILLVVAVFAFTSK